MNKTMYFLKKQGHEKEDKVKNIKIACCFYNKLISPPTFLRSNSALFGQAVCYRNDSP